MQPVFSPRTTRARVSPRLAAALAIVLVPLTVLLAFTWAPLNEIGLVGDAIQYDFPQKIFYVHVPIAFAAYLCFAAGAWNGLLYLLHGREEHDVRSYAGVHSGVVFGTLVLVTGSIWAKAAWGVWFQYRDRQLVVFTLLFLFYVAYFMLRFAIEPGRGRARTSAVYAVLGVALVPLSFLAIRIADTLIHPIVLTPGDNRMPVESWVTLAVGTVGFCAMAIWMMQIETAAKLRASRGHGASRHGAGDPASGVRPRPVPDAGTDASNGTSVTTDVSAVPARTPVGA